MATSEKLTIVSQGKVDHGSCGSAVRFRTPLGPGAFLKNRDPRRLSGKNFL